MCWGPQVVRVLLERRATGRFWKNIASPPLAIHQCGSTGQWADYYWNSNDMVAGSHGVHLTHPHTLESESVVPGTEDLHCKQFFGELGFESEVCDSLPWTLGSLRSSFMSVWLQAPVPCLLPALLCSHWIPGLVLPLPAELFFPYGAFACALIPVRFLRDLCDPSGLRLNHCSEGSVQTPRWAWLWSCSRVAFGTCLWCLTQHLSSPPGYILR